MSNTGWFFSFEGVDGAGKSTHIQATADRLIHLGFEVLTTREPGGTELSEKIRELVIHETMDIRTEALLMYASRVEHMQKVIKPALARGVCVITDRFDDSSFAYQQYAGGLANLSGLSSWALDGFEPDLTLLFDLPIEVSRQRIDLRRAEGDKFEAKPQRYFEAVREGFLSRAEQFPHRIRVIDAAMPEIDVAIAVKGVLDGFLEAKRAGEQ